MKFEFSEYEMEGEILSIYEGRFARVRRDAVGVTVFGILYAACNFLIGSSGWPFAIVHAVVTVWWVSMVVLRWREVSIYRRMLRSRLRPIIFEALPDAGRLIVVLARPGTRGDIWHAFRVNPPAWWDLPAYLLPTRASGITAHEAVVNLLRSTR